MKVAEAAVAPFGLQCSRNAATGLVRIDRAAGACNCPDSIATLSRHGFLTQSVSFRVAEQGRVF